jgi:hypothetical protein
MKRAPATSKTAPFPITLRFSVPIPNTCSHFDLDKISIHLTIHPTFHDDLSQLHAVPAVYLLPGVALSVEAPNLPASLCANIARNLASHNSAHASVTPPSPASLHSALSMLFARVTTSLEELLSLESGAVERYESVDAGGSTERRIKFLLDAELAPVKTGPLVGCSRSALANTAAQLRGGRGAVERSAACAASQDCADALADSSAAATQGPKSSEKHLESSLAAHLERCQRRFPGLEYFPQAVPDLPAALVTVLKSGTVPLASATFRLKLVPSDPAWQGGSVHLQGVVTLVSCAAHGSAMHTPDADPLVPVNACSHSGARSRGMTSIRGAKRGPSGTRAPNQACTGMCAEAHVTPGAAPNGPRAASKEAGAHRRHCSAHDHRTIADVQRPLRKECPQQRPVVVPATRGDDLAAHIELLPCTAVDAAAATMVNRMLARHAAAASGVLLLCAA